MLRVSLQDPGGKRDPRDKYTTRRVKCESAGGGLGPGLSRISEASDDRGLGGDREKGLGGKAGKGGEEGGRYLCTRFGWIRYERQKMRYLGEGGKSYGFLLDEALGLRPY
jgi:hypothetical protein